ncbi:MAG: hypothetical protein WCL06_15745 [Bacteroidota bacterium]
MRVAIFAEGRSDQAVLTNILKGKLNIDKSEIRYELPAYEYDQTDLAVMPEEQFSNWTVVKQTCEEKTRISKFLGDFDDGRFVIIQIDTAERHLENYNVTVPNKTGVTRAEYCSLLRPNIIAKINEWLDNSFTDKIAYAVGIEEIEAWVMTIYTNNNQDTSHNNDPKASLFRLLNRNFTGKQRKILTEVDTFKKFETLSSPFRKPKNLIAFSIKNGSLQLFLDSLENFAI